MNSVTDGADFEKCIQTMEKLSPEARMDLVEGVFQLAAKMNRASLAAALRPVKPESFLRGGECFRIIENAVATYEGDIGILESALGVLVLGAYVGRRPLLIAHGTKTLGKYQSILKVDLRQVLPPVGVLAHRCDGYVNASQSPSFWKCVKGQIKIQNRARFSLRNR